MISGLVIIGAVLVCAFIVVGTIGQPMRRRAGSGSDGSTGVFSDGGDGGCDAGSAGDGGCGDGGGGGGGD